MRWRWSPRGTNKTAARQFIKNVLSKAGQKKLLAEEASCRLQKEVKLLGPARTGRPMPRALLALAYFLAAAVALAFLVLPILAIFVHIFPWSVDRPTLEQSRHRRADRQLQDNGDRTGVGTSVRDADRVPAGQPPFSPTVRSA